MEFIDTIGITKPKSIIVGPFILDGQIEHKHTDSKQDIINGIKHTNIDLLDCILVKINGDGWYEHTGELKLNVLMNGHLRSEERDYYTCRMIYPFITRDTFEYMDEFLASMFNGKHDDCMFFPIKINRSDMPANCRKIERFEISLNSTDGIDSVDIFYFGRSISLNNQNYKNLTGCLDRLPYENISSELISYNTVAKFDANILNYRMMTFNGCDVITHVVIIVELSSKMIEFADIYFDEFQIMITDEVLANIPFKYVFDYYRESLSVDLDDFYEDGKLMIPIHLEELIGLPYIDIKSTCCSGTYMSMKITIRPLQQFWYMLSDDSRAKFQSYHDLENSYKSYVTIKYNTGYLGNHVEFSKMAYNHDYVSIESCNDMYKLYKRRLRKRPKDDACNVSNKYESNFDNYRVIDGYGYDYIIYQNDTDVEYTGRVLSVEI